MSKISILTISFLIAVSSCNNNSQNEKAVVPDSIEENNPVSDVLANDQFREQIIPNITNKDDLSNFNYLLPALDKKSVSFCQFAERLTQIGDSCYTVAKQKFPDESQKNDFSRAYEDGMSESETKYLASLNISEKYSTFAITIYNLDDTINNFCYNDK